ncbi:MAG: tetraacyldisaccharide 4'-kinase [Steroidobacteraceae bacterium]
MSLDRFAQRLWYERRFSWLSLLFLPLSLLFGLVVSLRRRAYRAGVFASSRVERPVIVIGNVTVGGTGKTPLVLWLANECKARGIKAAIICGGYGGSRTDSPIVVSTTSDPIEVGDEAVLLAHSFDGVVIACSDRVAAARCAGEQGADLVLCDDGLQHYRLQRDAEVVVVDAARSWGNGRLLPAGPLREPATRVNDAQLLVHTVRADEDQENSSTRAPHIVVRTSIESAISLASGEKRPLASFRVGPVHALAGIGNPDAFFAMLGAQGLAPDTRTLPDHAAITAREVDFGDGHPVLMTDKDAVKCRAFADGRLWRVPLSVEISAEHQAVLWRVVQRAMNRSPSE